MKKTIIVSSGKGGVGKTSIAVNMSILMSSNFNLDVVLVDADIGTANVNLLMGCFPAMTISDLASRSPDEVAVRRHGIRLIAGVSGLNGSMGIKGAMDAVMDMERDILVVDTHPGIFDEVLDVMRYADDVVIVSTTEITSLTDTYQLVKKIKFRDITARVHLLMNKTSDKEDGFSQANTIMLMSKTRMGQNIRYAGTIRNSRIVGRAIIEQTPFALTHPDTGATDDLRVVCNNLLME